MLFFGCHATVLTCNVSHNRYEKLMIISSIVITMASIIIITKTNVIIFPKDFGMTPLWSHSYVIRHHTNIDFKIEVQTSI